MPSGIVETMTPDNTRRPVTIDRTSNGHYSVSNARGGTISVGNGGDDTFTPVELLLTAIGACTAIDVDVLTSRRAEPDSFQVTVVGTKIKDEQHANRLADISVTFNLTFPDGEDGDKARALLPEALKVSHERLCTVSRTVEVGTPIGFTLE
jgi:putative redox protein